MLTKKQRKEYFKELGLGTYNEKNIKQLQKAYFTRKKYIDGKYGNNTDILLVNLYRVNKYAPHFTLNEFKCQCGGKHCTGYPKKLSVQLLKNVEKIRCNYNKPMTITCGLRCKAYNDSLQGSVKTSKHLKGKAVDFYMKGVSDTLANRKKSIKYIKTLPKHNYTYGNGISTSGYVYAPNMGNALHTEVK